MATALESQVRQQDPRSTLSAVGQGEAGALIQSPPQWVARTRPLLGELGLHLLAPV